MTPLKVHIYGLRGSKIAASTVAVLAIAVLVISILAAAIGSASAYSASMSTDNSNYTVSPGGSTSMFIYNCPETAINTASLSSISVLNSNNLAANQYFTETVSFTDHNATVIVKALTDCPFGTYTMTLTPTKNATTQAQVVTVTVQQSISRRSLLTST